MGKRLWAKNIFGPLGDGQKNISTHWCGPLAMMAPSPILRETMNIATGGEKSIKYDGPGKHQDNFPSNAISGRLIGNLDDCQGKEFTFLRYHKGIYKTQQDLVDFVNLKVIQGMFIYMPRGVVGHNSLGEYEMMHSTRDNDGNCIIVLHLEDKGWEGPSEVVGMMELVGSRPGMRSQLDLTNKQPGSKGYDDEMEELDNAQVESIVEAWTRANPNLLAQGGSMDLLKFLAKDGLDILYYEMDDRILIDLPALLKDKLFSAPVDYSDGKKRISEWITGVDDFMHTMRKLCNYEIFIEMLIWIGQKLRGGEIKYIYIRYYTHDAHDVFVEIQKKEEKKNK